MWHICTFNSCKQLRPSSVVCANAKWKIDKKKSGGKLSPQKTNACTWFTENCPTQDDSDTPSAGVHFEHSGCSTVNHAVSDHGQHLLNGLGNVIYLNGFMYMSKHRKPDVKIGAQMSGAREAVDMCCGVT
jgi:hypothetical protein